MEDFDELILDELKQKAIERSDVEVEEEVNQLQEELKDPSPEPPLVVEDEVPPPVKKTKKQRSQKQIEAFEKARLKRAENLKIKKQIEAEKKEQKKAEKELVKKQVKERLEKKETLDLPPPQEVNHITQRYKEVEEQPRYREQVVNNYYYYGTPPPEVYQPPPEVYHAEQQPKPKRGRKKKVKSPPPPPEPESESSSESEEEIIYSDPEEPDSFKELQNYNEDIDRQLPPKQNNSLKFRFA